MTREEAIKILSMLKAAYPNSYKGMTKDEANGTVNVWQMQFKDIPYFIVSIAVNKLIGTSVFPPAICEVKKRIQQLYWEAWGELKQDELYGQLNQNQVIALKKIIEVVEPMRTDERLEISIMDFIGVNGNMLEYPEQKKIEQ